MLFISLSVLQGQFSHHYRLLSTKVIVLSVKKKIIPNWDKTKIGQKIWKIDSWAPKKQTNRQKNKTNKLPSSQNFKLDISTF